MKSKKFIKISASEIESIIKSLSLIVVSIDHMGSAYYNKPKQLANEEQKFFEKINLTITLAQIRGLLSEAYNSQSIEADITKLEKEAEELSYWKQNKSRSNRESGK